MASKDKYKPNAAGTLVCSGYDVQVIEGKLYVTFGESLKVTTALGEFSQQAEGCAIYGEDPAGQSFPLLDDDYTATGEEMTYDKLMQALESLYIRTAMRRDIAQEKAAADEAGGSDA